MTATPASTDDDPAAIEEGVPAAIPSTAVAPIPDVDQDIEEQRREKQQQQHQQHAHSHSSTLTPTPDDDDDGGDGMPTDIEHVPVTDDPRKWSEARKWYQVFIVSYGALIPTMGANAWFPAIADIKSDLGASDASIDLSVSLYILAQGLFPLLWSPTSEIFGRKKCFMVAMAIYTLATGFTPLAKNMATVIVLRSVAAAGSAATLSIAAGSLADMYEAEERGVKVGVYYSLPISGPALAPILGGALTQAAGWRATFYFLTAAGGVSFLLYCTFKETFRTERSAAWHKARIEATRRLKQQEREAAEEKEKHQRDEEQQYGGVGSTPMPVPDYQGAGIEYLYTTASETHVETRTPRAHRSKTLPERGAHAPPPLRAAASAGPTRVVSKLLSRTTSRRTTPATPAFKPTFSSVSPLGSATHVLTQPHNVATLLFSGINFGAQYSLSFATTQTLTVQPYGFSPILVGCVLLALGVGGVVGSVVGGKLSDLKLRKVAKRLGHKAPSEWRLRTIVYPLLLVPPCFIGYGWALYYRANIGWPVALLFLLGLTQIWTYSVSLSYLVDANPGRSSAAISVNSAFRGTVACVASGVSSPLLKEVGQGALQSGWAVLIAGVTALMFVVMRRGERWREPDWRWPRFWRRTGRRGQEEKVGGGEDAHS